MKRIILITGLIFSFSLASNARKLVFEGKTNSTLGNYRIETDNKSVQIDGKNHMPFIISYENSDLEIRVAVDMDAKSKKYYVLSDNLSVKYVSNRHYFGVEMLGKELEGDGLKTSRDALNSAEYFRQKAITSGLNWRRDNTKLIAVYFPMLLKNNESLLAGK